MAGCYFVAGRLGMVLAVSPEYTSAIFPSSGIALAAVLVIGHQACWGVFAGSLLLNLWLPLGSHNAIFKEVLLASPIAAGATLQASLGAVLVKRFVGCPNDLSRVRDVLKFMAFGGPVSCLLSATIGAITLWLRGRIPAEDLLFQWWIWWLGDGLGVLVFTPMILVCGGKHSGTTVRQRLAVGVPTGFGFILAIILFADASHREQARIRVEFDRESELLLGMVRSSLGRHLELIQCLKSFFEVNEELTREQFHRFVAHILALHSGIQALEWVPRVPVSLRESYEKNAQNGGELQITEAAGEENIRAAQRSEYWPVYFVEPRAGNERVLGFDLASEAARREALCAARDSGGIVATGGIRLIQEKRDQLGVLVAVPIYQAGRGHDSIEERRENLRGFALVVFRIGDLIQGACARLNPSGLGIVLSDESASGERRLYSSQPPPKNAASSLRALQGSPLFKKAGVLDMGGRKWKLEISAARGYAGENRFLEAWAILIGGLFSTSLLGAFLIAGTRRTERLRASNEELQREFAVRKQAEDALRESEQKFRSYVERSPVAIFVSNLEGGFMDCNPAAVKLFGYEYETLCTLNIWDLHPEINREVIHEAFSKLADQEYIHGELRMERSDGQVIWVWLKVTLIDSNRALGFCQDITEHKQAECALRLFRTLIEHSNDAIEVVDPSTGRFLDVNEKGCAALGYRREEFLRLKVQDIDPLINPALYSRNLEELSESGVMLLESTHRRKDGTSFPVEINMKYVHLDRDYLVSVVRDITERKRAEAKLQEAHKQLIETSHQAGMAEVATNVLHNIGNVLNSMNVSQSVIYEKIRKSSVDCVSKMAALLNKHSGDLAEFLTTDPKGQRWPEFLGRLGDRLMGEQKAVLQELLLLGKEIGQIQDIISIQQSYGLAGGVREALPISDLVEDALRVNAVGLNRCGIKIAREYEEVPPISIEKHKVHQILVNLVSNAKSALAGNGNAEKHLCVRIACKNSHLAVSLTDNGVGIAPENLTRIYAYGFTTKKDGHGFGLHGAALAARQMGGRLTAQSDGPGKGATFTLELPLHESINPPNHETP